MKERRMPIATLEIAFRLEPSGKVTAKESEIMKCVDDMAHALIGIKTKVVEKMLLDAGKDLIKFLLSMGASQEEAGETSASLCELILCKMDQLDDSQQHEAGHA